MRSIFLVVFVLITNIVLAQKLQPFNLFDSKGKKVSTNKMFKDLSKADVILFGEFHDNSIIHWIQLQLVKELYLERNVKIGMEMLEVDNQEIVNQYLLDKIDQKQLDTLARLWQNYKTDYKPIVDFSKSKNIPVYATNIPRKYASLLYKQGEDALLKLPESDLRWIPTLPMPYNAELPAYKKMLSMFGDANHANPNFPKSQAIKDYAMASNILKNYKSNDLFIHFNGSYHSNNFEGIYWYLQQLNPKLRVVTISTVLQKNVNVLEKENKNISDYIFVTDFDITRTY